MLAPFTGEATWRGACKALSSSASTRPTRCLSTIPITPQIRNSVNLHQRKFSSSKASNASKDENRPIAGANKTTTTQTQSKPNFTTQNPDDLVAAPPRPRRRRSRDQSSSSAAIKSTRVEKLNLPSVPSTQQLHPLDIHLASFFSQHRPISITHNIPPSITQDDFASLFATLKIDPKSKSEDVIQALSAAVTHLDETLAQHEATSDLTNAEEAEMRAQLAQQQQSIEAPSETNDAAGGGPTHAPLDVNHLISTLQPFTPPPPPPPVPQPTSQTAPKQEQQPQASPQPVHTTYTSTVTMYETLHPSGQRTIKTVATPLVASAQQPQSYKLPDPIKQSYLERAKEYRRGIAGIMQLISVKRQRRLKMKKHKHKKLLKRTRNLRRKLDKT